MKYTLNQSRDETLTQLISDAGLDFEDEKTVRNALDGEDESEISSLEDELNEVEDNFEKAGEIFQSALSIIEHIIEQSLFDDADKDYKISECVADDLRKIEKEIHDFV